ncbi:MAG: tripartite tricarboxylate transporter TctB family protein [Burkholderiaceae bacterium]|nr:tripartite tricarboxylate transporter TctB family protein [Ottowia sp.]
MTEPTQPETLPERRPPLSDLRDAVGWAALGLATLIGSIRMDRLEQQHINPVTVPGLLPGLLGLAMLLLGLVLAVRSWRRGALLQATPMPDPLAREQRKRVMVATALCLGYAVVLVGHGLPFWLASSIYVTASILVFQRLSPDPAQRRLSGRVIAQALVIGILASVVTWLVFERVFLVRLP